MSTITVEDAYRQITAEDEAAGRPSTTADRMRRAAEAVALESRLASVRERLAEEKVLGRALTEEDRWQLDPGAEAARQADQILAGRRWAQS